MKDKRPIQKIILFMLLTILNQSSAFAAITDDTSTSNEHLTIILNHKSNTELKLERVLTELNEYFHTKSKAPVTQLHNNVLPKWVRFKW